MEELPDHNINVADHLENMEWYSAAPMSKRGKIPQLCLHISTLNDDKHALCWLVHVIIQSRKYTMYFCCGFSIISWIMLDLKIVTKSNRNKTAFCFYLMYRWDVRHSVWFLPEGDEEKAVLQW